MPILPVTYGTPSISLQWIKLDISNLVRRCIMARDQPNSREKMRDFTVEFLKRAKIHGRSLRNSRAPQLLFRGAMLMQTIKSVE